MPVEDRNYILAEFARFTGRIMPAAFLQHTTKFIPDVERIHSLLSGIYKPAWSEFALCIKTTPGSPYESKDAVVFLSDGRWLMDYSPQSGGLNKSDNRALMRCKDARVPLAVIQQVGDKTRSPSYRILGLGLINDYNATRDVFIVESADLPALQKIGEAIPDETKRYEMQLYAQLTNEFQPFIQEDRLTYVASLPKRDEAFREVLLTEYDYAYAVCEKKFKLDNLFEAQAAHIVPKRRNGTDDPRNGLTLCRAHHWAFDHGLFTVSSKYEIVISPVTHRAKVNKFELVELAGKPLHQPQRDVILPHPAALDYHHEHVYKP